MVVGFNHNFRYKGEVYHIQTEDSGVKSPNIVTLLYQGGTILASKKTSYADIAKVDNLDQVVEELMKEQHKEMLRSLKAGEFDDVIERYQSGRKVTPKAFEGEKKNALQAVAEPTPVISIETLKTAESPKPAEPPKLAESPKPAEPPKPAETQKPEASAVELSLDEVILSYLIGDDK